MDKTEIKAFVFDAYGTLLNINSLDERLVFYFGETSAQKISEAWRRKQLEYTWLRTLMTRYEPFSKVTSHALDFAFKSLSIHLDDHIRNDLLERYFTLSVFPEVPEILKKLSVQYKLAILSNANPEMLEAAVKHNQIDAYISSILSADSIRLFKPRPEVYELTLKHLQIKKEEIAFISSNTWDVAGAKSFGLKSIWLRRKAGNMEELGFEPDKVIDQLGDLL